MPEELYWNYRVIRHDNEDPHLIYYSIREVFYEGDIPASWSAEDAVPMGSSLEELRGDLDKLKAALSKPVLEVVSDDQPLRVVSQENL